VLCTEAVHKLFQTYKLVEEEEIRIQLQSIEAAHGELRHRHAWKVVNSTTGRKKSKEGQVAGNSRDERVNTWFTHFHKLLSSSPEVDDPDKEIPNIFEGIDINDGPFTMEEYHKVKTTLKLGKAAGPDGIPPEVFKSCDFDELCLQFCNNALIKDEKPELWSFMKIIPVPKSGDLSKTDNYRGISLTCIIAKIYNRMILNRIRTELDLRVRNTMVFAPRGQQSLRSWV
jgi:hypothetical protein